MPIKSLIENEHVVALAGRMRSVFDPFRTLAVEEYEIRHTTTLAWLLDEHGSHGLGNRFLLVFLKSLEDASRGKRFPYEKNTISVLTEVSVVPRSPKASEWRFGTAQKAGAGDERTDVNDVDGDVLGSGDERSARSGKAPKRLDLLIDGPGWSIAVEAKMRAGEGEDQLSRYESALRQHRLAEGACGLFFLTIAGDGPSLDTWDAISWPDHVGMPLAALLAGESGAADPNPEALPFMQHYVALIERISDPEKDAFHAELKQVARQESVRPLLDAAEIHISQLIATGNFDPLYMQHRWFVRRLLPHHQTMRANLAQSMFNALVDAGTGMAWQKSDPSKRGSMLFLPEPWCLSDARPVGHAVGRTNWPLSLAYKIEVKQQSGKKGDTDEKTKKVEVKLWLPPVGDPATMKGLWDYVATFQGKPEMDIFQGQLATKQFKQSGKLFSIEFSYDAEYTLDEGWNRFVSIFSTLAAAHREALSPVLGPVLEPAAASAQQADLNAIREQLAIIRQMRPKRVVGKRRGSGRG